MRIGQNFQLFFSPFCCRALKEGKIFFLAPLNIFRIINFYTPEKPFREMLIEKLRKLKLWLDCLMTHELFFQALPTDNALDNEFFMTIVPTILCCNTSKSFTFNSQAFFLHYAGGMFVRTTLISLTIDFNCLLMKLSPNITLLVWYKKLNN